jgi:predicted ATP-grasp superfamily ATP-dependent carboligase
VTQTVNRVLVFGDDSRSFLAVARSLGRKGIEVHAVPFRAQAPALKSRYVRKIHQLPEYDSNGRWIEALKRILESHDFDLIMPCGDRAVLCLDAHRKQLAQVRMALPNSSVMEALFDKHKTRALAEALGIPIPRGRLLLPTDTAQALAREFGLPLMIKMRQSFRLDRLERRGPVIRVSSIPELDKLLGGITPDYNLVEAHVHGNGVGVSVIASEGEVLCAFQHRRLKDPIGGDGSSLRISENLDGKLLAACRAIVAHCAMTGVAMFEFRAAEDGSFALIEVNARFWGSLPLAVASGVDFPIFLYDLLVHGERPGQMNYPPGKIARNFWLNTKHVLLRNGFWQRGGAWRTVSDICGLLGHPLRVLLGWEVSDTFQSDDLRPAFWEIIAVPRLVLRRMMSALKRIEWTRSGKHAEAREQDGLGW